MSKEIIINHTSHETRVAVLEGGVLSELHHEREQKMRIVDNIYKGKVLNVLPGMESAFVDIGSERAAFLHIDDILPEKKIMGDDINQNEEKPQISNIIREGQEVLVQVYQVQTHQVLYHHLPLARLIRSDSEGQRT